MIRREGRRGEGVNGENGENEEMRGRGEVAVRGGREKRRRGDEVTR